jgi:hypothetical protein
VDESLCGMPCCLRQGDGYSPQQRSGNSGLDLE